MKKILVVGFLGCMLSLGAARTVLGGCKNVSYTIDPAHSYDEICTYNGEDYVWCAQSRLRGRRGKVKGIWNYFSRPLEGGWFGLTVPDDVLNIPGWSMDVVWALVVIEKRNGDILLQEAEILKDDVYHEEGVFAGTASVIGGTDKYAGATGWLGLVMHEEDGGVLVGKVCKQSKLLAQKGLPPVRSGQ